MKKALKAQDVGRFSTITWDELATITVPEVVAVYDEVVGLPDALQTDLVSVFVRLRGVTPLLQHRPVLQAKKRQRGETYVPEEEAEKAAYRHPINGWLYVKNEVIRSFLRDFSIIITKRQLADKFMRSIELVRPREIPLLDPVTSDYIRTYEIMEYTGMLNPRVGRVVQWRPMIPSWRLDFIVLLNTWFFETSDLLSMLHEAFVIGGRVIGIGDWRPTIVKSGKITHTGGEYGRFIVDDFRVITK